jgi:DNA-directed RNA polymerase subunit L
MFTISASAEKENKPTLPDKYKDARSLMPVPGMQEMEFEIGNVWVELANAVRRTALDEKFTLALQFRPEMLTTNDFRQIVPEIVLSRIGMIPLDQSLGANHINSARHPELDQLPHFELHAKNDSATKQLIVTSGFINYKTHVAATKPFPETIDIIHLPPKCSIDISDIYIAAGQGFKNVAFSQSLVKYQQVGASTSPSDFTSTTATFKFNVSGYLLHPRRYMRECIDELIHRVEEVDRKLPQSVQQPHEGQFEFRMPEESYTIGNLYNRYIYEQDTTIPYIAANYPHPAFREFVLIITAPNAVDRIHKATELIKQDLARIKSVFV